MTEPQENAGWRATWVLLLITFALSQLAIGLYELWMSYGRG